MAELFNFGLSRYAIRLDGRNFPNGTFAVVGDTARRIEVQLISANGSIQDTTGLNLRLSADVAGKVSYVDGTLVDAAKGLYQFDLTNGLFLQPGIWDFQWQVRDAQEKKLHSVPFRAKVEKNITEGGTQAANYYITYEALKADLQKVASLQQAVDANAEEMTTFKETVGNQQRALETRIGEAETELQDVSVGVNDMIYNSPGEAVRAIASGEGLADDAISPHNVEFMDETNDNLLDPYRFVPGKLAGKEGVVADINYQTSGFIPVKAGDVLYAIQEGGGDPGAQISPLLGYDANHVYLLTYGGTNYVLNNGRRRITVAQDGYIRLSIPNEYVNRMSISRDSGAPYQPYRVVMRDNVEVVRHAPQSVRNHHMTPGAVSPEHTDFLRIGKNKVNTAMDTVGQFINDASGRLMASATYNTTDFIRVWKGDPVVISPRIRKLLGYTLEKKVLVNTYVDGTFSNYTFTPDYDGYIRFTYYASDKSTVQMERGSTPTTYERFSLETTAPLKIPNAGPDVQSPLAGKKLLNFGTSIGAGDGNSGKGYAEIIAEKYGATCVDYAVGGATVTKGLNPTNNIVSQVDRAIAAETGDFDFILWDGRTNDLNGTYSSTFQLGSVTTGYDTTAFAYNLDTFSGSMEYIFAKLRKRWPNAVIIFVSVHNMNSRDLARQKELHDRSNEIRKKWSAGLADLYSEGQMNTNIPEMLMYTNPTAERPNGDGTHPNDLGYRKHYVPVIVHEMLRYLQ